jgi:hypothetical protein
MKKKKKLNLNKIKIINLNIKSSVKGGAVAGSGRPKSACICNSTFTDSIQ